MAGEVAIFDQDALKKRVAQTIQLQFGMMIPDDQWENLVKREVNAFFEGAGIDWTIDETTVKDGWSIRVDKIKMLTKASPFRILVWNELRVIQEVQLKKYFEKPELSVWINDQNLFSESSLGEHIDKLFQEMAPHLAREMMRTMFAGAARNFVEAMREASRNGMRVF